MVLFDSSSFDVPSFLFPCWAEICLPFPPGALHFDRRIGWRDGSEQFVDGALGANNPVYALWNQAQDVWGDQLRGSLKCLVSIGTGLPALQPVRDDVLGIWATLKDLATETEKTAQQFHRDKSDLDDEGRYYRFNVDRGLEEIGLEESKKKTEIAAATRRYVESQAVFKQMKACANNIAGREC